MNQFTGFPPAAPPEDPDDLYDPPDNDDRRPTLSGHSRELANMSKIYTEEWKYGDGHDNFNLKLVIFRDICTRVELPESAYKKALPVMLKGRALEYYYTGLIQKNLDFDQLCTAIEQHFEDANHRRNTLTEWNNLDLLSLKSQNPDKSTGHCFELLISKLRTLRYGLSQELQSDAFMLNKLVLACRSLPECQTACSAPADTLNSMINTLKSSITAYEFSHSQGNNTSHTYMTDRRFRSNNDNRFRRRGNQSRFNRQRRCFVCDKEDCWSTNHTESERQQAQERFKEKYKSRFNNNFGRRFQKSFRQYVMDYEGTEDNIDDIDEIFQSIALEEDTDTSDDIEGGPETFLTSAGQISSVHAKDIADALNNSTFEHSLSAYRQEQSQSGTSPLEAHSLTTYAQKRYGPSRFYGIMIDTGASERSTVGYDQYLAYTTIADAPMDKTSEGEVKIKFGIGSTSSIGSVHMNSPIGTIEFHIVQADTPFLLSLADMDRLQVQLNNLKNVLITTQGDVPVVRQFGHVFLLWSESLYAFVQESLHTPSCFLTESELRHLHNRFGHPSVQRLHRVLERSGHEVDRDVLQHLTKYCASCQKHGASPGRFRFTLRDDVEFNYCIYVDIMYIHGQPLLTRLEGLLSSSRAASRPQCPSGATKDLLR
jgi:thymidylate synthase